MSTLKDKATALLDALKAEGHHLVSLAEEIVAHLKGDETELQAEAVADGEQVAHDAEAAMGPVLAEAEKDAAKVGSEAAADVQAAVTDTTTPPASA